MSYKTVGIIFIVVGVIGVIASFLSATDCFGLIDMGNNGLWDNVGVGVACAFCVWFGLQNIKKDKK